MKKFTRTIHSEPLLWLLIGLIVSLSLLAFWGIRQTEQQRLRYEMRSSFEEMTDMLELKMNQDIHTLTAVRALFDSSENVQLDEFRSFTNLFLKESPEIYGLAWAPRVWQDQRQEFENSIRDEWQANYSIFEMDSEGKKRPVGDRQEYFPVTFYEPSDVNSSAIGYDIGSTSVRLEALVTARESGNATITAPLDMVQDPGGQIDILVIMPVYRKGAAIHSAEARHAGLEGVAIGSFQMDQLVAKALETINRHDIELYLFDIEDKDHPQFLAFYPSISGDQSIPAGDAPSLDGLQTDFFLTKTFRVGNRAWLAVARPGPDYSHPSGWGEWISLIAGLFTAGVLGAYVNNRQKIEEILSRSEAEFRSLSDNALTGIVRFRLTGEIVYANEALARMFGYPSPGFLIGLDIGVYLRSPEPLNSLADLLVSGKQLRNQVVNIDAADGEKRHLLYSAALNVDMVSATVVDLTDRIRSEDEIRQLSRIVLQMADTVVITDVNGVIEYINPAFEQQTGYSSTEAVGQTPRILKSGQHSQEFYEQLWVTILRGDIFQREMINRKKNGDLYTEVKTITPIRNGSGVITHFAATGKDITEIKTAQLELEALNRDLERRVEERTAEVRQSEAVYRALFENSNDGIFLMTPEGEELKANQRALDMVEYSSEEYQALTKSQQNALASPEQRQEAAGYFAAVVRGEQVPLYERTFISRSGRKIQTEVNLSVVRDHDGKVILVQSVVRDVTERKKAEEALRLSHDQLSIANAALEKATRLKDEFLASMSHELRTPLTGILGLSEVLQMQTYGPLNEKQLKAVKNIESSGRHLLDLINDILDLSKIEAGKLDLQIAPCSIVGICQASLQLVKGMAHQKNQNISFSINPASVTINADMRRLKQMLVNLLSNAVKFTPPDGRLGLEVQGNEAERVVRLCVWDEGIGIKAEDLSKLFKPFMQLDSSLARQYTGTGLGLSLVQRMAELHGGSVEVESTPGAGSRFTIILPWIGEPEVVESEAERTDAQPFRSSLTIEDNIFDAEHVSRYLQQMDINNVVQPMVKGALEKAVALRPSVILLDLYLPDGYGLDLLVELKTDERTKDIPIVITSIEEKRSEAMHLGASGYLVKPFVKQDLHAELERAAGSTRPTKPVMVIGPAGAGPLVMMADDNEMILEMITGFLSAKGYQVATARSGAELLERVPELHPDILLVDIQMPGMDGMETIRRLRLSGDPAIASTPIIAVTALAMMGDREKCLQAGADDYMSKPVVLTKLAKRIEQLLEAKAWKTSQSS